MSAIRPSWTWLLTMVSCFLDKRIMSQAHSLRKRYCWFFVWMDHWFHGLLRLVCREIWNTAPGGICLFGICCNSFTRMWLCMHLRNGCCKDRWHPFSTYHSEHSCVGFHCFFFVRSCHTAGRDIFNDYMGNQGYEFVALGNLFMSRLALAIWICFARGIRWVVEQPEGSSLPSHPRFQAILEIGVALLASINHEVCMLVISFCALWCNHMCCLFGSPKVFSGSFWMGAFGGATAKRHRLWSNCKELLGEVVKQGQHSTL